ncbi:hypothetical protein LUZ60_013563 [Juncus effusus]|nr:hypothetical protein LUZ60_013563 [Juncus effusus]
MSSPTISPLSPLAPHSTPEKSDLPPPPPHPLPPPATIAAHAARRESTRTVNQDGWYSWTGEDLPPAPAPRPEKGRTGGVRSVRDETKNAPRHERVRTGDDRSVRDETQTQSQIPDGTIQDSSRGVKRIMRREKNTAVVRRAVVATRVTTTVLCLIAFSILAADRHKGWALDSYNNYSQFRYCVTVNVLGFIYSCFQLYAIFHHNKNGKHIIKRPAGNYFDFIMDQVLAYLLISATSSATARVGDWIVNWGSDPFPNMANGSIAVSFLAFLAFALSALLSAYNLFNTSF